MLPAPAPKCIREGLTAFASYARWHRVRNFSMLAIDDWIMITAVPLFYTGLIATLNVIAAGGGSNLFPPEQFASMSQFEIDERVKGSKIVIISEQVCSHSMPYAPDQANPA
jgi:hypothetical protein